MKFNVHLHQRRSFVGSHPVLLPGLLITAIVATTLVGIGRALVVKSPPDTLQAVHQNNAKRVVLGNFISLGMDLRLLGIQVADTDLAASPGIPVGNDQDTLGAGRHTCPGKCQRVILKHNLGPSPGFIRRLHADLGIAGNVLNVTPQDTQHAVQVHFLLLTLGNRIGEIKATHRGLEDAVKYNRGNHDPQDHLK